MASNDEPRDFIQGIEMDVDAFTAHLRDLADAIDEGEVGVLYADDGIAAPSEGMIESSLYFDYMVERGREDLLRPIQIEERDDGE